MKIGKKIRAKRISKFYKHFIKGGMKVLDVGCGDGSLAFEIRYKLNKIFELYGTDIINKNPAFKFKLIENNKLPYADKEFEIVMLNDVLHHIPYTEQEIIINECKRVADKVLICEVPDTWLSRFLDKFNNKNEGINMPLSMRSFEEWKIVFGEDLIDSYNMPKSLIHPVNSYLFCVGGKE